MSSISYHHYNLDMSTTEDLANLLKDAKKHALSTASRRGQRPQGRKSREQLLSEFDRPGSCSTWGIMRFIILPEPYLPCMVPFSQLDKMLLRDLLLETHHRGRYLIVRTISKPSRFDGVIVVAEDEEGDTGLLDLYNQLGQRVQREAETQEMPPTGVYVVKEPFFHTTHRGDNVVRVDHVSDIVWLPDNDNHVSPAWSAEVRHKTAEDWKQEGTAAMQAMYYRQAIAKYTTALACAGDDENEQRAIRLERAMAYMKYQCYEHALADFSSFQAPMKLPAIGLYQAALALYTLRRFDECQSRLMELLEDYPDDKPGQEMLLRARQRLHEQKTGDYDFSAMYEKLQRGQRELDIATYTSSLVIGQTESHGRGLFTTEAVKAGQLLTCEKASVYCCPAAETVSATDFITVLASPHDSMGMLGAEGELVKLAVQQIFYNRSAASNIVESYCGSYKPTTVTGLIDGQPVVDYFHVVNISRGTAFSSSLSTYHAFYAPGPVEEAATTAEVQTSTLERFRYRSAGLWPFSALLNHSCISNVERCFIGDALIMRATVDMPAGTELTTSYVRQGDPTATQKLRVFWGFECQCALCADERCTPPIKLQRRELALHMANLYLAGLRNMRRPTDVRPNVDLPTVEARVLEAARQFAQPRQAPQTTAAAAAAAAASTSGGPLAAASSEWVPRQGLADVLNRLSAAYARAARALPTGPGSTAADVARRRAYADKAAAYALSALRQLGYVVRETGGRWRRNPDIAGGRQDTLRDTTTATAVDEAAGRAGDQQPARPPGAGPRPPLVVLKWGARTMHVERIWFSLVRAYLLGDAPAALVDAAKGYARTSYCFMIGEDTTFEREFAKEMSENQGA